VRQREKKRLGEEGGHESVSPRRICRRTTIVLRGSRERSRRSGDVLFRDKGERRRGISWGLYRAPRLGGGVGFRASGTMDGAVNAVREEVSGSEEEDDLTCRPRMSVSVGGRTVSGAGGKRAVGRFGPRGLLTLFLSFSFLLF
jgi:hypothetical protein